MRGYAGTKALALAGLTAAGCPGGAGSDDESTTTTATGSEGSSATGASAEVGTTSATASTFGTSDDTGVDPDSTGDTSGNEPCRFDNAALRFDMAGVYGLPDQARDVVTGDFDEDGSDDLVFATGNAQRIDVYLSAGDWRTPTLESLPLAQNALAVAVGDLDGDGHLDLLASGITVFLGDGNGGFVELDVVQVGVTAMTTVDMDGDGDLDVAAVSESGQNTRVLLNDGTGVLSSLQVEPTWFSKSIAAGDVDGDGDADLLVASDNPTQASALMLLRNLGDGTIAPFEEYGAISDEEHIEVGDVDGDGDLDAIGATNFDAVYWLENDGTGSFATQHELDNGSSGVEGLAVGDFDGDGDIDLVTTGHDNAVVHENDGQGTFTTSRGHVGRSVFDAATGDLDGDGQTDFAMLGAQTPVGLVMLGDGAGTPYPPNRWLSAAEPNGVALGDFDGDGTIDMALSTSGIAAGLEVALDVAGGLSELVDPDSSAEAFDVEAGDFDGDGLLDPIAVGEGTTARVLVNDPRGGFAIVGSSFSSATAAAVAVGNFDADDHLDAALLDGCILRLGLGLGTGELQSAGMLFVDASSCSGHDVADLDADDNADIVVAHYSPPGLTTFAGMGDGTFGRPASVDLEATPFDVAAGDADGDGDADLFVASGPSAQLVLNDGGMLTPGPSLALPPNCDRVRGSDLDGDGVAEGVVSCPNADRIYVLKAERDVLVIAAEHAVLDPERVAIADADGDCIVDLAVAGGASETAALLRGLP